MTPQTMISRVELASVGVPHEWIRERFGGRGSLPAEKLGVDTHPRVHSYLVGKGYKGPLSVSHVESATIDEPPNLDKTKVGGWKAPKPFSPEKFKARSLRCSDAHSIVTHHTGVPSDLSTRPWRQRHTGGATTIPWHGNGLNAPPRGQRSVLGDTTSLLGFEQKWASLMLGPTFNRFRPDAIALHYGSLLHSEDVRGRSVSGEGPSWITPSGHRIPIPSLSSLNTGQMYPMTDVLDLTPGDPLQLEFQNDSPEEVTVYTTVWGTAFS